MPVALLDTNVLFARRAPATTTTTALRKLSEVSKVDFNASQAFFRRCGEISFVDSTIAAYMEREGIEYLYSFDDDFDVLDGVTRLETADSPLH